MPAIRLIASLISAPPRKHPASYSTRATKAKLAGSSSTVTLGPSRSMIRNSRPGSKTSAIDSVFLSMTSLLSRFLASLSASATLFTLSSPSLIARDLVVDQRGGAEFKSLSSAATAAQPGDRLVIAKGSGPYRETLRLRKSGTPEAPITVEGNGETITGFTTLSGFTRDERSGAWVCRLPQPFPLVLTFQGRRILQDQETGRLIGPVTLRDDQQTIELAPNTPTEGWEVSTLQNAVQIADASHQIYRNIVATGATNDGFNLHGEGTGLVFENITAAQNLDDGFSAHGTIECEIRGGDFWGNDNGLGNVGESVVRATSIKAHDNLGWGLWLGAQARGTLSDIQAWGNGVSQIRFDRQASGSCLEVLVWPHSGATRPWVTYQESSIVSNTSPLGNAAASPDSAQWEGSPKLAQNPAPPSGDLTLPLPAQSAAEPSSATLNALISNAIASGQATLKLPKGVIRLDRTIEIRNASNLEINGTDTTLVMTSTQQALLRISKSSNLTIRGLTLDYDPLPFTQGTITKVNQEAIEIKVHEGYPSLSDAYSRAPSHFFTADGRRHPGSWDFNRFPLEILNPREGRLKLHPLPALPSPGDLIALDRRYADATSAVEIRNCPGAVTFEDVKLHASPGLCFVGRYGDDLVTFRRVTIEPGPLPAGATQPRLLSSNADGVNFVQYRRGPIIENCDFSHMGDDSVNLHGFLVPIIRQLSPTSFLAAYKYGPSDLATTIRAGDAFRLYKPGDFALAGTGHIAALTPLETKEGVTSADIAALFTNYPKGGYTIFRVDTTEPLEVKPGQWFDIPSNNCANYIIRDNYFHDHRGRALRLMASDGLVENNRFERLTKSAISIGPELGYWREAGWVENLRITGNTLRDIGVDHSLAAIGSYVPGAIGIFVRTENATPPYPNDNRAIVIENNRVENTSVAAIHGYAARNVVVRNNNLINTNTVRPAGHIDLDTHLPTTGPITLYGIPDAVVENNQTTNPAPAAP